MLLAAASVLALDAAVAQEQGAGQATGQGGTVLEAIVVEGGAGERGDGPVDGYVAKKSLAGTKTDTPISKTPQTVSVVSGQ